MAKPIDINAKLEQAAKIREEANERAKQIEKDCLDDLKKELKDLDAKRSLLTAEIERISGKPSAPAPTSGKKRVNGAELEGTILAIVKEKKNISCADIMKHEKMVALYGAIGKKVSQQANLLSKMVEEKKLDKSGDGKKSLYSIM